MFKGLKFRCVIPFCFPDKVSINTKTNMEHWWMSLTDAYRSTGTKTCPSVPVPLHPQHVSRVLVCMKPGPHGKPGDILRCFVCLFLAQHNPPVGQGLLIHEVSRSHTTDTPQSVGLLRTSDQLVAQTST